eukprot:6188281-Pleurochrysis_carterae.AAC.1
MSHMGIGLRAVRMEVRHKNLVGGKSQIKKGQELWVSPVRCPATVALRVAARQRGACFEAWYHIQDELTKQETNRLRESKSIKPSQQVRETKQKCTGMYQGVQIIEPGGCPKRPLSRAAHKTALKEKAGLKSPKRKWGTQSIAHSEDRRSWRSRRN